MKNVLLFLFLLLSISVFAQDESDKVYSVIDVDAYEQPDPKATPKQGSFFWGSDVKYAVYQFTNVAKDYIKNQKEQQALENSRTQSLMKLTMIKNQYAEYEKYPERIVDGWHKVVATDNSNFCKDTKVLVENNKIKKFVIDNYLPVKFTALKEIKNAKNMITIEGFNGEQLSIMEIYFLYDLEEPVLTTAPEKPGVVCFWTDQKRLDAVKFWVDDRMMEKFTIRLDDPKECLQEGMICRILKPGTYHLKGVGRGSVEWDDNFEIKAGLCLKYRLGK